jgi:membrane protein
MKASTVFVLMPRVFELYFAHNIPAAAAAITFYALFSLAPTLIFAIAAASHFLGNAATHRAALEWLADWVGAPQAEAMLQLFQHSEFIQHGLMATVFGGIMLLWGSSTAFVQLRITLNGIFGHTAASLRDQLRTSIFGRLLAAMFAIFVGGILVMGMVVSAFLSYLKDYVTHLFGWPLDSVVILTHCISWAMVGIIFASILHYLPREKPSCLSVLHGSISATLLFELGKYIIGVYIGHSAIASAYGPASTLVATLLWIYYSAQTFLLGALVCRCQIEKKHHKPHPQSL